MNQDVSTRFFLLGLTMMVVADPVLATEAPTPLPTHITGDAIFKAILVYSIFSMLGIMLLVGIMGWAVGLDDETAPIAKNFDSDGNLLPTWTELFRALISPAPPGEAPSEARVQEEEEKEEDQPLGIELEPPHMPPTTDMATPAAPLAEPAEDRPEVSDNAEPAADAVDGGGTEEVVLRPDLNDRGAEGATLLKGGSLDSASAQNDAGTSSSRSTSNIKSRGSSRDVSRSRGGGRDLSRSGSRALSRSSSKLSPPPRNPGKFEGGETGDADAK